MCLREGRLLLSRFAPLLCSARLPIYIPSGDVRQGPYSRSLSLTLSGRSLPSTSPGCPCEGPDSAPTLCHLLAMTCAFVHERPSLQSQIQGVETGLVGTADVAGPRGRKAFSRTARRGREIERKLERWERKKVSIYAERRGTATGVRIPNTRNFLISSVSEVRTPTKYERKKKGNESPVCLMVPIQPIKHISHYMV